MDTQITRKQVGNSRSFSVEEMEEIINSQEPVSTGAWRWGRVNHYVVVREGKNWYVSARFHAEDGWQREDGVGVEVVPVEVKKIEWLRVQP